MRDELLQKIKEKSDLPPLPDILIRLESKIEDPRADINEVAQLIETEPVLAGRLLALSNSVFFGAGREKIQSMKGAVLRLGLKLVLDLAYTLELPSLLSGIKNFNQEKFWKHSLAVGILARQLCNRLDETRRLGEQCYLAGLMHDIGILVFYFLVPGDYAGFLKEAEGQEASLEQLEQNHFGIGHAELGSRFIEKWWPVDPQVVEAIRRHHEPLGPDSDSDLAVATVHLANAIAYQHDWEPGLPGRADPLNRKYLVTQGMTLESYLELVEEARASLDATHEILMH